MTRLTTKRRIATYLTLASMTLFSVMPGKLLAGPVGEQVEAGSATFTRNGNNTVIDVSTQNAIINYESFNMTAAEYVRFNQLNAQSRVLNRINGASPTHIDGTIHANGQVFFVNPAGVMFGQNAVLDVAGIYAAAGSITSTDFLNGMNRFTNLTGDVINHGTINSQFVALVGKRVVNEGIIFAPGGVVTMVSGDEVVIGEKGGTIMVKVDGGDPNATDHAVVNTGTIDTGETGQVSLGAGDMYWLGVKQEATGSIKAGDVIVEAPASQVEITGTVDSSVSTTIVAEEIAFYTVGIGSGDVTMTGHQVTVGNISGDGGVMVYGTERDDLHILDFNYGYALPGGGLSFDALGQQNPKPLGDSLLVRGGSFDTVGITFTDSTPDGFSGELNYDGYTVNFAGFEPLANTGDAANIVYSLPGGGNTDIVLSDDGTPNDDVSQIDATTFELTTFTNPTNSLTINLGADGDTITLDALDAQFNANLIITGGAGADTLIVNAVTGGGTYSFDGGTGSNTIVGPDAVNTWNTTADNAGTVAGVNFTQIQNLTGGSDNDTFNITHNLAGDIVGSDGNNVLNLGANVTVGGGYTGGTGDDTITLETGAAITGTADFGAGGTNTLDYNANAFGADATINLETSVATGIGGIANLTDVIGHSTQDNTLVGANANQTWNIVGSDAGNIGGTFNFTNFANLTGGSLNDNFTFASAATLTGDIVGSGGTNTLTHTDGNNNWTVTGANAGTVDGLSGTFADIANLVGGTGNDAFVVNDGGSLTGTINGGAGTNTLLAHGSAGGDTIVVNTAVTIGATTTNFSNIGAVTVNAGTGDDNITVTPQTAYTITIDGGADNDTFTLNTTPLTASPTFTPTGTGAGDFIFPSDPARQMVDYTNIETLALTGPHATINSQILLDTFGDNLTLQLNAAGTLLEINGSTISQSFAANLFNSLTITGNGNDNTLTIQETAGGLPGFGGTAAGSHTNAAFTGSTPNPANVGLHFDGGAGSDTLAFNFTTARNVGYFADTVGTANSGVVAIDGEFNISFEGLAPVLMDGAGGTLNINTTAHASANDFLLTSSGGPDGRNIFDNTDAGAFESIDFGGFDAVDIVVGNGNPSSVTLQALDANEFPLFGGTALTQIDITGGNEVTTVNIEDLPATITLNVSTGGGNDVINIATVGQSLDPIQGAMTLSGGLGAGDVLNIDDSASSADRSGNIDDATITGFGMANGITNYTAIEIVNFFAGDDASRSDTFTIDGSSAANLNVHLNDGLNDQITVNLGNFGSTGQTLNLHAGGGNESLIVNDTSGGDNFAFQLIGGNTALVRNTNLQTIVFARPADVEAFENLRLNALNDTDNIVLNNSGGFTLDAVTERVILRASGSITDSNDGGSAIVDIRTNQLILEAGNGIDLQTDVSELAFLNSGSSSDVIINNINAANNLLTLRNLGILGSRGNLGGGETTITNTSPLTITDNWTFQGDTTFTASVSPADDHLTFDGSTVTLDGNALTLNANAGDDILFINGGNIASAGAGGHTVNLNADGSVSQTGTTTSVVATNLNITAPDGIGSAVATPFRFDTENLTTDTTGNSSDQFLRELNGLTTTNIDADTGDVHLHLAAGTANQDATDAIVADALSLTGSGSFVLDADNNDVGTIAATVTGGVTFINALDAGPLTVGAVTDGQTGIALTGGALALTADGIVVDQNMTATGIALVGRSDDAVATPADTLIAINAVTLNAGGGAFTLTGENLAIDAAAVLQGTGALTIQPVDATDDMEIGGANDDALDDLLQISDAEIATLADGFSGIFLGRTDGEHDITVNSATFTDPITIRAPVAGTISLVGTLAGTGNASVTILGSGATTVFDSDNPAITTHGQAVLIDDSVIVAEGQSGLIDTTLGGNSAGANVTINGTVDGQGADTDGPNFAAGDEERLIVQAGSGGTLNLLDDVGTTADLILDLQGNTLNLGAGITVNLGNTTESQFNFNNINFNGATISGTGVIQFAPLSLSGNIGINSDTPGAMIFDLDNTTVTTADDVNFADGFALIVFGQSGGTGLIEVAELANVTFSDSVHFLMNGAGGSIDIGNAAIARQLISTAVQGVDDILEAGFAASVNAYTFTGPGNTTTIFADEITAGMALEFNDAVVLDSPTNSVRMDTTNGGLVAAGADITFNNTLNADSPGNQRLELFSGTAGDIVFVGAVGANNRLGDVFIGDDSVANDATDEFDFHSVTASNSFFANSLTIKQFADGGNVQFEQGIDTAGYSAGAIANSEAGGNVLINTDATDSNTGGDVTVSGTINTSAILVAAVPGEDAGDVTIIGSDVTLESIIATGGQTNLGGADGGAGGNIVIDARDALVDTPLITLIGGPTPFEINTGGGAGGAGGNTGTGGDVLIGDSTTPGGGIDFIRITTDDYGITTGNTGGNITFDGFVEGAGSNNLILTAGSQAIIAGVSDITFNHNVYNLNLLQVNSAFDVTFNEMVGFDSLDVADALTNIDITATNTVLFGDVIGDGDDVLVSQQLRIRSANDVTANAPVVAGSILQDTGTGATTFNEAVTTNTASGINISTERVEFGDTLGDDTVTVNAAGNVVIAIDVSDTADVNPTNTLVINDNAPFVLNGGGSFTQQGAGANLSIVELGANITTQGGGITFRDHVEATQNVTLSTGAAVGGNILFDQNLFALNDAGEIVTLTAGSGNISVNGPVGTMTAPGDRRLGQLLINSANISTYADTIHVMDFTQLAGTGQTEFQGDVAVFQDFTNADVLDSNAVDLTATGFFLRTSGRAFFNNAGLAVTEVTPGIGGANIVMQVGDADFTGGNNTIGIQTDGGATRQGVLVLEPFAAGGNLNAGTGGGGLALSNNDINALAHGDHDIAGLGVNNFGFGRIFLGRSDGTGSISLNNAVTFHAPLFVRAPMDAGSPNIGNITIGGSGGVVLTELGDEVVFDAHVINLGGSVTTNAGDILFVSGGSRDNTADFIPDPFDWLGEDVNGASDTDGLANVTLVGNSSLDSAGGNIVFENNIDGDGNPGDFNLTLNAGATGDIAVGTTDDGPIKTVTGRVGGTDRIGAIEITNANNVTFGGDGVGSNANAGTGSIDATSFRQLAGIGNTTLFGTTVFDGVETSLRTGGYANPSIDGGDVEINIDGDFFAAGAIITRGGNRSTPGSGRAGGAVLIDADSIEVHRIDTRGSAALGSGDGGNAGAITLDGVNIILRGDLLATGGAPIGGVNGSAADIELGSDPALHAITLDPVAPGAHGQTIVDNTVVIQGNDVIFDATIDADAPGQSLFVDTFANFTQTPIWGLTEFNGNVGDTEPLQTLRVDTNQDLRIDAVALVPRTPTQANDTTATNRLIGGFTSINTDSIAVSDEMTFQSGVMLDAADVILIATDVVAGTVRFNNTLHSAPGENNDLTINAETTIFNDLGNVGQGFVGTDAGGVAGHVGGTADPFAASLGALRNPLDTAAALDLNPIGVLITDGAGTTFINTAFVGVSDVQFGDAVIIATDNTIHATGNDGVAAIGNKTAVFESTIDSLTGELNSLRIVTTDGGTTRFNGIIGGNDPLSRLQTDLPGDIADTGVSDGVTEINTTAITLDGASAEFNDAVVLFEHVVITELGLGDVVFNQIVDSDVSGPFDLTVNTTGGGRTIFRSEVGTNPDGANFTHLRDIVTDAAGITEIHADMVAETVNIFDPLLIGLDENAGNIVGVDSFGENIDGIVTIGLDPVTTDVIFHNTVDSIPGENTNLTVNATTLAQFMQNVGDTDPLGVVIVNDHGGQTVIGDNTTPDVGVSLEADQFFFNAPVVLEDDVTITGNESGDGTDSAALAIAFNNTVDSDGTPRNLTTLTTAGGLTRFGDLLGTDDRVGAISPLNTLTVSAPIGGNGFTLINADIYADVMVFHDQLAIGSDDSAIYTVGGDDVVTLGGSVAPTDATSVTFHNTIDSFTGETNSLFIDAITTRFGVDGGPDAIVGGANPLDELRTTNGPGADQTFINTSAMFANILRFDDPVRIDASIVTLTGLGIETDRANLDEDAVQFNNTLDSAVGELNELFIETPNDGVTRFGDGLDDALAPDTTADRVGALDRLAHLETDLAGEVFVFTDQINTNGATVIHNDPVVLFNDVTYSELVGNVIFNNTVDSDDAAVSPRSLTVNTDLGDVEFHGRVGDNDALRILRTDTAFTPVAATGQTLINTDIVNVTDEMTFNEAVTIGTGSTLTAQRTLGTDGIEGTIRFNNTLDSSASGGPPVNDFNDLTLVGETVIFDDNGATGTGFADGAPDAQPGTVGGINPLGVLTVTDTGLVGADPRAFINTGMMTANTLLFETPTVIAFDGGAAPGTVTLTGLESAGDGIVFDNVLISQAGEFNNLILNTPNGGDTRFNDRVGADLDGTGTSNAVADGTEIGDLTTDAAGTTFINTDIFQTSGNTVHNDAVEIQTDIEITNFLGNITFNGTVDATEDMDFDVTFALRGATGDLTFNGVVGDRDGDGNATSTRLGDVNILDVRHFTANDDFKAADFQQGGAGAGASAGRGNTVFIGFVDMSGLAGVDNLVGGTDLAGATPGTGIGGGGDIVIQTDGGIVLFGGGSTNGVGTGASGNIILRPGQGNQTGPGIDLFGGLPDGLFPGTIEDAHIITLAGTFTAVNAGGTDGNIFLSPEGRNDVPLVATIRGAFLGAGAGGPDPFGTPADGDVHMTANKIMVGPNEKITVFNDLTFIATQPLNVDPTDAGIIHSDVNALGNITFDAAEIRFYRRLPSDVIPAFSPTVVTDLGLDIFAGGFIAYSVTPQGVAGTVGPDPIFGNPTAEFDVNNTLLTFIGTTFSPIDEFQARYQGGGLVTLGAALDLSTNGPSNANAAEALAAAIPTPEQSGEVVKETIVGDLQRSLLAEFAGVDLEGLTQAQRLEFLTGRELYNDLPGVSPVSVAVARALLTENRLLYDPVANMLTFYRNFFLEEVINPETGQVQLISRHIEHRRALASAFAAYGQTGEFDPAAFSNFLIDNQEHANAYRVIQGMKTLSEKFTLIGLNPRENAEAMLAVAERITPEGMTREQLIAVIRVTPSADARVLEEPELGGETTETP